MFDRALRRVIDPMMDRLARPLAERGLSADLATWSGFACGVAAMAAIAGNRYLLGLAFFLGNRLLDGLDGSLARARAPRGSDRGAYLDILLDFIVYAGIVFAFAMAQPERALAAAFLIFSFVGTGTSFLAFAIFAERRGLTSQLPAKKGFFHIGGLAEGGETIALFAIASLRPDWFEPLAWTAGALCWLTTVVRVRAALKLLPELPPS